MVTVFAAIGFIALVAAAGLCIARAVSPVGVPDRIVALDLLLVVVVLGVGVAAYASGSGVFLDVLVVVSLIGFIGTVTVARFVERRGA